MISGVGDGVWLPRCVHGEGKPCRQNSVSAAVALTSGIVEASSKEVVSGIWNVVAAGARAYSAYAPPGVSMGWKAATLSPTLNNEETSDPRAATVPARSSPELSERWSDVGCCQSLGLEDATTTLMSR